MLASLLAATNPDQSNFVDLDVPVWAWLGLLAIIAALLAIRALSPKAVPLFSEPEPATPHG